MHERKKQNNKVTKTNRAGKKLSIHVPKRSSLVPGVNHVENFQSLVLSGRRNSGQKILMIPLYFWTSRLPQNGRYWNYGGRTTKMTIVVAHVAVFFWLRELPAARPPTPGISQRRHLRERAAGSSKWAGHRAAVFVHGWSTFWRRHHQTLIQPVFQHTCNKKNGCRASIMVKDCGPSPIFKRSPMEMLLLTSTSADENKSFRGGNKVKRWQQRNGMRIFCIKLP